TLTAIPSRGSPSCSSCCVSDRAQERLGAAHKEGRHDRRRTRDDRVLRRVGSHDGPVGVAAGGLRRPALGAASPVPDRSRSPRPGVLGARVRLRRAGEPTRLVPCEVGGGDDRAHPRVEPGAVRRRAAGRATDGGELPLLQHAQLRAVAARRDPGACPMRVRRLLRAGRYVDHWVTEYWDGAEHRWVRIDAPLDALQRAAITPAFDPEDQPPGPFLPGGEAWQQCRRGEADPATFGILDFWGLWFVQANVVRDLAALNKMELLPWDVWGPMSFKEDPDA